MTNHNYFIDPFDQNNFCELCGKSIHRSYTICLSCAKEIEEERRVDDREKEREENWNEA